jgi:hypothetical protein
MHIQIVTYRVEGVSDDDFVEANREFAAAMAAVPGLLAKVWLKEPAGDGYGGLYLWRDREAYETFWPANCGPRPSMTPPCWT